MIGHLDRLNRDGTLLLEELPPGHAIFRQCFEDHRFGESDPKLSGQALFQRCTFIRCIFRGELKISFEYCRFIDCNFLCGNPQGIIEQQTLDFVWCELNGRVFGREGAFSRVRLKASAFSNCCLSRINFAHPLEFEEVRFYRTRGLPSCSGLDQVRVVGSDRELLDVDLRDTPLGLLDRIASWERLRTFGRLPLFGTSLTVLVAIPTVFFLLAIYNGQLMRLRERAAEGRLPAELNELIAALHPIPVPSLSFWLLLSTVLLGIASTLFTILCPSRVREFSLDRWTDELRQSAIQYLPRSWSRRWARAVAAPCYLIGGGGSGIILVIKLCNAGRFIVQNSVFPW